MRIIALLACIALPALADDVPINNVPIPFDCRGGICVVPESVVDGIIDNNNRLADEVLELRVKVKAPVTCAKTDVTEPSKEKEARPKIPLDPRTARKS